MPISLKKACKIFRVNSDLFQTSLVKKVQIWPFSANMDQSGSTGFWTKICLLTQIYLTKFDGSPKHQGVETLQDPVGHFWAP